MQPEKNDASYPIHLYFQEAPREMYCPIVSDGKINSPFPPHNFGSLFLMPLIYFDVLMILLYKLHLAVSSLRFFLRKTKV